MKRCALCGTEFKPKRKTQKYCSYEFREEIMRRQSRECAKDRQAAKILQEKYRRQGKAITLEEAKAILK